MDKYTIKLLPKAYKDIENIYSYISRYLLEEEIATKIIDEIEEAIFSLEGLPYRGNLRDIGMYADHKYRQIIIKNFNII